MIFLRKYSRKSYLDSKMTLTLTLKLNIFFIRSKKWFFHQEGKMIYSPGIKYDFFIRKEKMIYSSGIKYDFFIRDKKWFFSSAVTGYGYIGLSRNRNLLRLQPTPPPTCIFRLEFQPALLSEGLEKCAGWWGGGVSCMYSLPL